MPIEFTPERWQKIKEDSNKWWAGQLDRPLIQFRINGAEAGRSEPAIPYHGFTAFYKDDVSPDKIVDRWDYELSRTRYLGDAFPSIWPNFGPGVMSAFIGAKLETGMNTVWFHPQAQQEIADISFEYNPDNPWLRRVCAICQAAMDRWNGAVQVGMTDLGGNLDILSVFRPSELLPMDLLTDPEEVKRITWDIHALWQRYYEEIHAILRPRNPGYTAWASIFSEKPYYMLQCDFSYMIGPDQFEEFVLPELAASCKKLVNPFYHLDGVGELPHLDLLLSIPELKGVQWVPGAGKPGFCEWPDVQKRILDAGKLAQVYLTAEPENLSQFDAMVDKLGTAKGIVAIGSGGVSQEKEVLRFLERYGVL